MLKVELEDFEIYRPKLLKYASSLLRNRGFCDRQGELEAFSKDVVQNTYLRFNKYNKDTFVSERHLENCLIGSVYKEYLNTIDLNRRGAQYILMKTSLSNQWYKEEFKQLNVRKNLKIEQEDLTILDSFKSVLNKDEINILDKLIEGYTQKEISEKFNIHTSLVFRYIKGIREKYNRFVK